MGTHSELTILTTWRTLDQWERLCLQNQVRQHLRKGSWGCPLASICACTHMYLHIHAYMHTDTEVRMTKARQKMTGWPGRKAASSSSKQQDRLFWIILLPSWGFLLPTPCLCQPPVVSASYSVIMKTQAQNMQCGPASEAPVRRWERTLALWFRSRRLWTSSRVSFTLRGRQALFLGSLLPSIKKKSFF